MIIISFWTDIGLDSQGQSTLGRLWNDRILNKIFYIEIETGLWQNLAKELLRAIPTARGRDHGSLIHRHNFCAPNPWPL